MRVGIDLDGCVYNFIAALRNYRVSKGIPFESMPEPQSWEMWRDWGMSKEEFSQSMAEAEAVGLFHQGEAYDGAIEALQQLKADGHSLHIITHRWRPHAQTSTIGWLAVNEVPYDTLTFAENKGGYPVDLCIEDNIDNARAIEACGITCVLMSRPWNESEYWYPRVSSWPEFLKFCSGDETSQPTALRIAHEIGGEVRKTSPTGGQKGSKPEQYSMIPVAALSEVARVYSYGAEKYDRNNWRKGYSWHLSYDALQRHVNRFWAGEDFDPESGLHHLAHAAFHLFTLITYGGDLEKYAQYDDRHREVPG